MVNNITQSIKVWSFGVIDENHKRSNVYSILEFNYLPYTLQ